MKKYIFLYILYISFTTLSFAQSVGINTSSPNASAMLDVYSTSKGLSFPKINLQGYRDITTIPNPKESLIIFNDNGNLLGEKTLYYWNGNRWGFLFADNNSHLMLNLTKYYSAIAINTYTFGLSDFKGLTNHNIGDAMDASWTVITDLSQDFSIERSPNQALVTVSGMIHANNTSVGSIVETSFGLFIDDKLVDVKPFTFNFNTSCSFKEFNIYMLAENITKGVTHTVKIAARNRYTNSTQSNLQLSYGKAISTCGNLSDTEAKISSTIFITQPYDTF